MERTNVTLDENWISPSALAKELEIAHTTVSSWITRNKIDYVVLPGALRRRYLVDRRTAPEKQPKGWPRKENT